MEHFGTELKKAREARGISLREMATRTKISVTALDALEREDVSRLPGGIFGRSFVRAYALDVGVDPDVAVSRFVDLLEKSEREAAERRRLAQPEITLDDRQFLARQHRAVVALRVAIAVLAGAVLALVFWQVKTAWSPFRGAAGVSSAAAAPVVDDTVAPETATVPAPPPAEQPLAGDGSRTAALVIDLDVSGECWLSVSLDGRVQTTRQYRAGENVRYEADQQVLLDVDNAGMVRLRINGKPARPLGAAGVHVRTRITRDNINEFF